MVTTETSEGTQSTIVIVAGGFMDKGGQHTSGTYQIVREGNVLQLTLKDDFQTDEGPDLHVVLSPTAADRAEGHNAMSDKTSMVVGPLVSLSGSQVFDLPEGIDLTPFQSVLIHCIQYSHLYGAAPIQQASERTSNE